MTTTRSAITVYCDESGCAASLATNRTTTRGARGDAERAGWTVSHIYSGTPSQDPDSGDRCPEHNPYRRAKQDGPDLFSEGVVIEPDRRPCGTGTKGDRDE